MNKERARGKCRHEQTSEWSGVLRDAELALTEAKARVRALKRSIAKISEKVRDGEPLPEYLRGAPTQK